MASSTGRTVMVEQRQGRGVNPGKLLAKGGCNNENSWGSVQGEEPLGRESPWWGGSVTGEKSRTAGTGPRRRATCCARELCFILGGRV